MKDPEKKNSFSHSFFLNCIKIFQFIGRWLGNLFDIIKKFISRYLPVLQLLLPKVWNATVFINKKLSPRFLVFPDKILVFIAMFLFSFMIIALEMTQYHILQFVTDYLKSSFVISIAMLGIALGGLVAYYLGKIKFHYVLGVACILVFLSIILSYYNIINIGALKFPYLLILPFFFGSVIISTIFSHAHSNFVYFTNLIASAAGVIAPIILVPIFKSENTMFLLMFVPIIFLFFLSLRIPHLLIKLSSVAVVVFLFFQLAGFIQNNISVPETISAEVFEEKIMKEMPKADAENYVKNFTVDFFSRVYKENEYSGDYEFVSDEYDRNRATYFLQVLGFYPRAGIGKIPFIENRTILENIDTISAGVYEYELIPLMKKKYTQRFKRNTDRKFLEFVYKKSDDSAVYHLVGDEYDKKRARYLLTELGHIETVDLNFDVRYHQTLADLGKIFTLPARTVMSEDNMLGRVEYRGNEYLHGWDEIDIYKDMLIMAINGMQLDVIDCWPNTWHDPRVPWMDKANVFIIGLSADGIVKGCTQQKTWTVSGIEIIPSILETMQEGQFATFAMNPYKNTNVYKGEGRSYLQNTKEKFDEIFLMNIHAEHSVIATLGPENFHTVEGTKLLLNKLTDRGYVVYEEILGKPRTIAFYMKFINTVKQAMLEMGIEEPERHFYIFKWGFYEHSNPFRTIIIKRNPFTQEEKKTLDSFFKANVDANTSYGEEMLYSPYYSLGGTLEEKVIKGNILYTEEIPSFIDASDFNERILNKIEDPSDVRNMLLAYPYSGGVVRLRTGLSKEITYNIKRILDYTKYPYKLDLTPATDDKPFPFNVYQEKTEIWEILNIVIILSLIVIIPLFFLILNKAGQYKMSLLLPSLFTAVIGFGYMFVEIALMQKFQHFIGAPTFSLIVVLGGLLLFSGLGSFVSKFFSKKIIIILTACIPIVLVIMLLFLDSIFVGLAGLSFEQKLAASALLILPLTFLMGIPFPNALEIIKKYTSNEYGALMFGVSGAFATIASTSSILVTALYGFSTTFIAGMIVYIVGLILFMLIMIKPRLEAA